MQTDTFRFYALEFPFPIAYWFRRALDRDDSTEDIQHLFVSLIEFVGVVLIGDYVSSEKRDTEVDRHLLRIIDSPVPLGDWRKFIVLCLEHRQKQRAPVFLKELDELLDRSAQREMQNLIEWRNEWVHTWPDSDRRRFRATLFSLLQRVHLIHRSTLFSPRTTKLSGDLHGCRSVILRGDNPNFSEATLEASEPLETDKVYLASAASGWILPLHPFLTFSRCDNCSEMHYFHLRKVSGRKLAYASLPGGHVKSSSQDLVSLESLLKVSKDRVIRPRYLAIPGMFSAFSRTLQPGDPLGPYRIEFLIKLGGMAQIYQATDTRSGATRALKVLPIERARDPALLMRFEAEATNLQRLEHPSIIKIHDAGKHLGDHYLVLGLAEGRQVGGKLCLDVSDLPKPCSEGEILAIAKQACAALDYIHAQSFVHRDLKPGNLLLAGDKVILTDFGIARPTDRPPFTLVGLPAGTPEYMAPEQAQQGEIDGRTDLYSLGCVLYELATGQPPYKAESPMGVLYAHLHSSPPEIEALNPAVSRGLINIVKRLLQKDPERRYPTARGLYDHLVRVAEDPAGPQIIEGNKRPEDLKREEEAVARERARYRKRLSVWVGGLAILVLLTFLLVLFGRSLLVSREVWLARAAWEENPLAAPEVCEHIQKALIASPHHSGVSHLLYEIRQRGALRVRTEPSGRKVRVTVDPESGQKTGLGWFKPEILKGSGEGEAGDWFFLAPGHYKVIVEGLATPIPVLIAHDFLEEQPDHSWLARGLLPQEGADRRSAPGGLVFAGVVDLAVPPLAGTPLEDVCYVPPGPCYLSRHEGVENAAIPHEPVRDQDVRFRPSHREAREFAEPERDIHITTGDGFWIGTREVTVGEFQPWLEKHGKDLVDWLGGKQARILINDFTRSIPLDLLYAKYGGTPADGSEKSLEHFLKAFRSQGALRSWEEYTKSLATYLESKVKTPRVPVVNVRMVVALAYAQTHAPLVVKDLADWLRSRIQEAVETEGKLKGLLQEVQARPQDLLPAGEIPGSLKLWLRGDGLTSLRERGNLALGYRTPFEAYAYWLTIESGFAVEMPLEAMAEHARRRAGGLGLTASEVSEALQRLRDSPETFVEKDEHALLVRNDFWSAMWKDPQSTLLEKKHFGRWLEAKMREVAGEAARLRGLEAQVAALRSDSRVPDSIEVPWDVRLEHGYDMGWTLPTASMFERALRGPDTRPYPWGVERVVKASLNNVYAEPLSVDHYGRGGDEDVSVFGVMGLAGNVSEWVLVPDRSDWLEYAKGGCYWLPLDKAVAGRQMSLGSFEHRPWIGFRVVREQLSAGPYKRHAR